MHVQTFKHKMGLDRLINYMYGEWVVMGYGELEGYNNTKTC